MQLEMRLAGLLRARTWRKELTSEFGTPECRGIAYQCDAQLGRHIVAESYIVEILKDGQPAQPDEVGDVVVTDLDSFSVPLIRYQTGDRAVAAGGTCPCGRPLLRLTPVEGHARDDSAADGQPIGIPSSAAASTALRTDPEFVDR
jgi:phenylacetate-coenzyme A ligase PaaK-like adenylate-forming protein